MHNSYSLFCKSFRILGTLFYKISWYSSTTCIQIVRNDYIILSITFVPFKNLLQNILLAPTALAFWVHIYKLWNHARVSFRRRECRFRWRSRLRDRRFLVKVHPCLNIKKKYIYHLISNFYHLDNYHIVITNLLMSYTFYYRITKCHTWN